MKKLSKEVKRPMHCSSSWIPFTENSYKEYRYYDYKDYRRTSMRKSFHTIDISELCEIILKNEETLINNSWYEDRLSKSLTEIFTSEMLHPESKRHDNVEIWSYCERILEHSYKLANNYVE